MASIRILKKDIDYLIEEILSDCYLSAHFNPDKEEKTIALMEESVDFRNSLIDRVNMRIDKEDKKATKKHFAQIRQDLFAGIDKIFDNLSAINKETL